MGIEDFKRWHWIVISVIVGAVLAYTRLQFAPDETSTTLRRGIAIPEFISLIQMPKTSKGYSMVSDVVVYPAVEGKSYVTGQYLEPRPDGKAIPRLFQLHAEVPFRMPGAPPPPRPDYSIRDYLDQVAKTHPDAKFQYAWWTLPHAVMLIWGGTCVLIIGGVWPTIVNLMIGAGLGRPKKARDDYDLDRFGNEPDPQAAPAKLVTAGEQAKLDAALAAYEKNLGPGGIHAPGEVPVGAAPVKQLNGGPMELSAAALAALKKEEEDREYKGEYYPVARPVHHEEPEKAKH